MLRRSSLRWWAGSLGLAGSLLAVHPLNALAEKGDFLGYTTAPEGCPTAEFSAGPAAPVLEAAAAIPLTWLANLPALSVAYLVWLCGALAGRSWPGRLVVIPILGLVVPMTVLEPVLEPVLMAADRAADPVCALLWAETDTRVRVVLPLLTLLPVLLMLVAVIPKAVEREGHPVSG
ncbi:hypothetical protein HNP84_000324 [Thermocatellispora tengchongensis]|uniref:Uncharacterized protein n=1 Tax=Thermocatellispora tengchongensis TaxID=1073253 RepID=A0A840NWR8_9ACTN|nr:hypothetical protein [Thermocatellispora tengchongensis]MBB5130636.1 hypothetical protein [Thermocatellispora tengchongensis]